jgi:CheY-like chemotaxis protein
MEKKTILVVEDEHLLLHNIVSILNLFGFSTLQATNASDALTLLQTNKPDLILSDVMMGEIDGFQFIKMVKEIPSLSNIQFVFLTALADVIDRNKGMVGGADAYVTKPFSGKELVKTINQILYK